MREPDSTIPRPGALGPHDMPELQDPHLDPHCFPQPDTRAPGPDRVPPSLGGMWEIFTPQLANTPEAGITLPLPRRNSAYYPGVLGVSYRRTSAVEPLSTPLHGVLLQLVKLDPDGGFTFVGSEGYVLVDTLIRFFTILSDGERSVVPPFVGAGADPYGFHISWEPGVPGEGQLRAYGRWMPRTNAYPALLGG